MTNFRMECRTFNSSLTDAMNKLVAFPFERRRGGQGARFQAAALFILAR